MTQFEIEAFAGGLDQTYGKSAYMLVYECKQKNPLRVVEQKDVEESQIETEEIVTSVPYNAGLEEKYIPDWLR